MGCGALNSTQTTNDNTALGFDALTVNTGSTNTAVGACALR